MTRAINFLMCVAILTGLALFFTTQSKLTSLRSEYDRLTAQYGVLDVKDASKFYVKRIETENEMEFRWRVYRPGGIKLSYRSGNGESGSGFLTEQGEVLYNIRIVAAESGLEFHQMATGAGRSTGHHKRIADFVKEHWSELNIETIADGEHDSNEVLQFLRILIPPPLVQQLAKQKGGSRYKRSINKSVPLFEYSCGTSEAYAKAEKR